MNCPAAASTAAAVPIKFAGATTAEEIIMPPMADAAQCEERAAAAARIALLESEIEARRAEIAGLRLVLDGPPSEGPGEGRDDELDRSEALHERLQGLLDLPDWIVGNGSSGESNACSNTTAPGACPPAPVSPAESEGEDSVPNTPLSDLFDHCKLKLLQNLIPPLPFQSEVGGDAITSRSRTQLAALDDDDATEASGDMSISPNTPPPRAFDICQLRQCMQALPPPPLTLEQDSATPPVTKPTDEPDCNAVEPHPAATLDDRDRKIKLLQAVVAEDARYMQRMLRTITRQHSRIARLKKANTQRKRTMTRLQSAKVELDLELQRQVDARNAAVARLKTVCRERADKTRRLGKELAEFHSSLEDEFEKLRAENVRLEARAQGLEEERRVAEEKYRAATAYERSFSVETERFGILL
ncbi:hypothetical protein ACHAXT_003520 [Thalassiosira profunda]